MRNMRRFVHLDWPFLEPRHKQLALELDAWAREHHEIWYEEVKSRKPSAAPAIGAPTCC